MLILCLSSHLPTWVREELLCEIKGEKTTTKQVLNFYKYCNITYTYPFWFGLTFNSSCYETKFLGDMKCL